MSKADNMLSILWLLKTGKRMTAKKIAEALEINIRTVYRHIDSLCASGVPIIADSGHNGGYSLLRTFTEAPLFFDNDEQKALVHASIFALEAGYPYGEHLNRAINKLKRYTNPEQLDEINRHEIGFDVIHPPSDGSLEASLQQLEQSVASSSTVSIAYFKGNTTPSTQRQIDPYGLVFWKSKWYIVAFCHLRQDIRSFRVDRIQDISATEDRFERPAAFSARQYFLDTLLPDANDTKNLISVRIQGKEGAIRDLSDHWLFGHLIVDRSDTEIHFMAEEHYLLHYTPYILLGYGTSIRVSEPVALQQRMLQVTSKMMEYYQSVYTS
ncbi:helix-turn-helix transcriptional regulator [Cohnella silvisoli]|uniref:YafY family protein n=1 Tax=Cohnella silvisoli TaxID=2873699 RepID=A0ABV1KLY5_9BACL|nr:YafY family protein [Cohnella silvisoli]MCD9020586.1 YafY family transcriptional regulator [Cohnella silvisoli]